MTNKYQEENLAKKLLAVRDVCGFTADYLVHNLHHFDKSIRAIHHLQPQQ